MKIIAPYTEKLPIQDTVLESMKIQPDRVDVSADDEAYWRLLSRLWQEQETFILLEHDILPWPGALQSLWACPQSWCGFTYLIGGRYDIIAHGLVKYSSDIQKMLPDILDDLPRHWQYLDSKLIAALREHGETPHYHGPPVIHLNQTHFPVTWRRVWGINPAGRVREVDDFLWSLMDDPKEVFPIDQNEENTS